MAIRINEDFMTLTVDDRVMAIARFSEDAAADGNGAWIVSTHSARLFSRSQAIAALTLTRGERCATALMPYLAFSLFRSRGIIRHLAGYLIGGDAGLDDRLYQSLVRRSIGV
jgi:hypothetical protein